MVWVEWVGGATAYLVGLGGKMNPRVRLTSAKVGVGVEVEAELGNMFFPYFHACMINVM